MNNREYTASNGFINKHHYPFGLTTKVIEKGNAQAD
jgi:hypothetical protein